DLDVVPSLATYRALVWDNTEVATGQQAPVYAGTDQSSVFLYLQPDPSQDFLVDTDGDGVCDSIATTGLRFQQLNAIPTQGDASYSTSSPDVPGVCTAVPSADPAPDALCASHTSDMTRVIHHAGPDGASEPVIYGIGDLAGAQCTGGQWDIASITEADGWV